MHFICFVVIFVGFAINVYCCAQLYQIMLKTDNANCSLGVIAIRRILKETVHIFQSICNSAHFFFYGKPHANQWITDRHKRNKEVRNWRNWIGDELMNVWAPWDRKCDRTLQYFFQLTHMLSCMKVSAKV